MAKEVDGVILESFHGNGTYSMKISGAVNHSNTYFIRKSLNEAGILPNQSIKYSDGIFLAFKKFFSEYFNMIKPLHLYFAGNIPERVVLDFRDSFFEDISGVALSLEALKHARTKGFGLELYVNENVHGKFKLAKLDSEFNFSEYR